MASRTIQTTENQEDALRFLAAEAQVDVDTYLMNNLSLLFGELSNEANQKRYDAANEILKSNDPAKIIPALRDLLK